jgi:hypothetical protein
MYPIANYSGAVGLRGGTRNLYKKMKYHGKAHYMP